MIHGVLLARGRMNNRSSGSPVVVRQRHHCICQWLSCCADRHVFNKVFSTRTECRLLRKDFFLFSFSMGSKHVRIPVLFYVSLNSGIVPILQRKCIFCREVGKCVHLYHQIAKISSRISNIWEKIKCCATLNHSCNHAG